MHPCTAWAMASEAAAEPAELPNRAWWLHKKAPRKISALVLPVVLMVQARIAVAH